MVEVGMRWACSISGQDNRHIKWKPHGMGLLKRPKQWQKGY